MTTEQAARLQKEAETYAARRPSYYGHAERHQVEVLRMADAVLVLLSELATARGEDWYPTTSLSMTMDEMRKRGLDGWVNALEEAFGSLGFAYTATAFQEERERADKAEVELATARQQIRQLERDRDDERMEYQGKFYKMRDDLEAELATARQENERLAMQEEAARNSLDDARGYIEVLKGAAKALDDEACSLSRAFNQPLSDKALESIEAVRRDL